MERAEKLRLRHVLLDTLEQIWHPYHRMPGAPFNPARQKEWERIYSCQAEWIGYKAACCDGELVAVPIGCNHRLCPLCNTHRAEKYRDRVEQLFEHMRDPLLLTLTVPNVPRLSKTTFRRLRAALKRFLAQQGWIDGGVYSIETTYNVADGTWHPHVHVLVDSAVCLPRRKFDFVRFKRAIEFSWLRCTGGRESRWGFARWNARVEAASLCARVGLPEPAERPARRVCDIRNVRRGRGAACEIVKYITKVSAFSHIPAAVDEFLHAVKHTRMIQAFGKWYGHKFSEDVNDPRDWKQLTCTCGVNAWEQIGLFHKHEVTMDDTGRWRVRAECIAHRRKPPDRTFDKFRRETHAAWSHNQKTGER